MSPTPPSQNDQPDGLGRALSGTEQGLGTSDREWDEIIAAFPMPAVASQPSPPSRPRSTTVSVEIMRDAARRAEVAAPFVELDQAYEPSSTQPMAREDETRASPLVFPSIRPSLVTPPLSPAPPVVQRIDAAAVIVAPHPRHTTPAVAQLEDTLAAGPTVSTARKGKKRARIDSTSPSPAAAPRNHHPPSLPMSTPSQRERKARAQGRLTLGAPEWATPSTPHGQLAPHAVDEIKGALLPPPPPPFGMASTPRQTTVRPPTARPAPSARPAPTNPFQRARPNDENAGLGTSYVNMDLDLPLRYPPASMRPPQPYGMPLQSLDLNRVRFPDAYQRMGPLSENEADGRDDASIPEIGWTNGHLPQGVLSVRDRPPTPHPARSLSSIGTTPSRVVSHSAAALAASFTLSQPIPIPTGQPHTAGPIVGTATYFAATNIPVATPTLQFTPAPPGGFPMVYLADPDGLFTGLSPARGVALRGDPACFIVRIHNLANMTLQEARHGAMVISAIVTHVTGESNPLVVPPDHDAAAGTVARRGRNAISFGVLGISVDSVLRMLQQSTYSSTIGTLHLSSPTIAVSRFVFVAGGFAHDHNGSILNAVFAVFSGPNVLPHIVQLVQSHPDYVGVRPEDAARAILASLEVRVSTLQNGNLLAAIFCDPPTLTPSRWIDWRARVAMNPFTHPLNSTGYARRAPPCAGCHGEDHPTHLCPFQDIPGWNAPPPGTTWSQPGHGLGQTAAPTAAPPPPPPPPAAGNSTTRNRAHSGRRGTDQPPNGNRRDYRGGGDGRAGGSGSGANSNRGNGGTGFGGGAGYHDGAGTTPF